MTIRNARILCIDDDPDILDGLSLSLRGLGDVHLATGGESGLALAASLPTLSVVICDMRMPGRDGAQILAEFSRRHPDTTRLLLTGYSDIADAVAAINTGRIFRFLQKPCPRETLQQVVQDAIRQHALVTAEQELLEQTVRGCLSVLVEGLAVSSPAAYGQCRRLCDLVARVIRQAGGMSTWVPEAAIMLSGLGLVSLDAAVQEKLLLGKLLDASESRGLQEATDSLLKLLDHIPRIAEVRDLLRLLNGLPHEALESATEMIPRLQRLADLVTLVREYVRLEASGFTARDALARLARRGNVPTTWLSVLEAQLATDRQSGEVRMILPLSLLQPGMVLAQPIHNNNGLLLAPAGHTLGEGFWRRLTSLRPDLSSEKIAVIVPACQVSSIPFALRAVC